MNPDLTEPPALTRRGVLLAAAAVLGYGGFAWCVAADAEREVPTTASGLLPGEERSAARSAPREGVIELGMSAPFTGPTRGHGIELYRGAKAYFDHLNARGGVHGRPVAIRAYDDGYNPGPAIENTARLIEQDGCFALFSYVGTPTTTRCLPLLKQFRGDSVVLLCPFTGAQPHRQPPYREFVFNLRASYYEETAGLVDHFVRVGRPRVAVFYQADAYGRTGWEGVRAALGRHGLKMAGEATYRRGTAFDASLRAQVDLLRGADPDAVICVGSYAACAAFVRDARAGGWAVPIANVSFVGSESLLALLHEAGRTAGTDYTHGLINSQVVPSPEDLSLPAVREYRELMARHQPAPPAHLLAEEYRPLAHGFVSLEGFLNAKLVAAVLGRMGPPFERARLRPAAEAVRDLDLGTGTPVSFGPDRHQASDRVYFTVVRDGRFEPLTDWEGWRK